MLLHELADNTIERFLAVDCIASDAVAGDGETVEELEDRGWEDGVSAGAARLLILARILARHKRRESTDVVEHLLHKIVHVLWLCVEGLCIVGVAWRQIRGRCCSHRETVSRSVDMACVCPRSTRLLLLLASIRRARCWFASIPTFLLRSTACVIFIMSMSLLLSLLRLLKQTTNHISNHTQQASSRTCTSALTLSLPAPIQIVRPVERSMKLARRRCPLPLKMVDVILIWVRRIPRIVVLQWMVI
jgi:hypothetical protein